MSGRSNRRLLCAVVGIAIAITPSVAGAQAPGSPGIPTGTFNPGIYYRQPVLDNPGALLTRLDDPISSGLEMAPVGWDMCRDLVVFPTPAGLELVTATGAQHTIVPQGLYRYVRPSFSPDCRYAAVQASATPDIVGGVEDLNIYVVDLGTGAVRRIGTLPYNEESPRFFPVGNKLAYSSFSPTEGVNLHVYDFDVDGEVLLAPGAGALQIAIAPDGSRIFDPRTMRMYDAVTGAVSMDLLASIAAALPAAGFDVDTRFRDEPGTPNRGMYPLDASFSSDGLEIILDWAVRRGPTFGNILVRLTLATRQMTVVSDLVPTNPEFTNHNNFSQLNPVWK